MNVTEQDRKILSAISDGAPYASWQAARKAGISTSSPSETAARHLIKLTKMGLASKEGSPMFPAWRITELGSTTLDKG